MWCRCLCFQPSRNTAYSYFIERQSTVQVSVWFAALAVDWLASSSLCCFFSCIPCLVFVFFFPADSHLPYTLSTFSVCFLVCGLSGMNISTASPLLFTPLARSLRTDYTTRHRSITSTSTWILSDAVGWWLSCFYGSLWSLFWPTPASWISSTGSKSSTPETSCCFSHCTPTTQSPVQHPSNRDIEILAVSIHPVYLPREFPQLFFILVYIHHSANPSATTEHIGTTLDNLETISPDSARFILGELNHCSLNRCLNGYQQCVTCTTRQGKTLNRSTNQFQMHADSLPHWGWWCKNVHQDCS